MWHSNFVNLGRIFSDDLMPEIVFKLCCFGKAERPKWVSLGAVVVVEDNPSPKPLYKRTWSVDVPSSNTVVQQTKSQL